MGRNDRVWSNPKVHCDGSIPPFQQSGAPAARTADSSALLEWRNKLIQHYMADREDESRQAAASRILADLQSRPERWERGCGDNTSRPRPRPILCCCPVECPGQYGVSCQSAVDIIDKPLWCQAVTHTSAGCLSLCSDSRALTPFHVNEDSPVTDKK